MAPTEEGYRYFVTHVVYPSDLPEPARDTITHQFYQARQDVEGWMPLAASILAHHSRAASLVTALHADRARYKHLELISTQGRQVLMVLVMTGGEVSQQILTLAESRLSLWTAPTLLPVVNATGVILHTNLGRAPLSVAAIEAMKTAAGNYSTLEYVLEKGQRGSRLIHAEAILQKLTCRFCVAGKI